MRNVGIDMATDPLFTVFTLDVWMTTVEHNLQHELSSSQMENGILFIHDQNIKH